jgi:hypothetical protein
MAFDPESATEFKIEIPKGMIRFGGGTGGEANFRRLAPSVQQQLIDASMDYHAQTGKPLHITSGHRTRQDQQRLYDESVAAGRPGKGPQGYPIAKPGESKHEQGTVVDILQGRNDPVALDILSKRGFSNNVKNDAVHFEYTGAPVSFQPAATQAPVAQPQMAATVKFDPGSAQEFVEPQPQPQAPSRENQVMAGISGFGKGATAGLIQYPQALALRATRAVTGGEPMTFSQSLQEVRQGQGQLQQENPLTYGVGELGGTIAGLGKAAKVVGLGANPVQRLAGLAGVQAGISKATESPETTAAQAIESGGMSTAGALALGGAGKAVEAGLSKYGERTLGKSVQTLIDAGTPEARQGLAATFGPAYKSVKEIARDQKPTMESVRAQILKDAPELATANKVTGELKLPASLVLNQYKKSLSAWEKSNAGLKDIETFAQRYADNPVGLQKYVSGAAAESTTGFAQGVRGAADRLQSLNAQAFGQQLVGQALTLGGLGGLGAGAGALYGYATGQDPLTYAIGGGGGLPLAAAAARFGGTRQFLNPTTMGSMGGSAVGSQGYRLSDMIKPQ